MTFISNLSQTLAAVLLVSACASGGHVKDKRRATETCGPEDSDACFRLAERLSSDIASDPEEITNLYRRACEFKNVHGCVKFGVRLFRGKGTTRNQDLAMKLWHDACGKGDLEGCADIGLGYIEGTVRIIPNLTVGTAIFKLACNRGETMSCVRIADMRLQTGASIEHASSLALLRSLCDKGNLYSCGVLGFYVINGYRVKQDLTTGKQLLAKSCRGAYVFACTLFGEAVLVRRDTVHTTLEREEAVDALRASCNHFESPGCKIYAQYLLESGWVDPRNIDATKMALERCCALGDGVCCWRLAVLYEKAGLSDVSESLFEKGCNRSSPSADSCVEIGRFIRDGRFGVPAAPSIAALFFTRACNARILEGCTELGLLYQKGLGVEQDLKKARSLYFCSAKYMDGASHHGCKELGMMHLEEKNPQAAAATFILACNYGEVEACHLAARLFDSDIGLLDPARARYLRAMGCSIKHTADCESMPTSKKSGNQ